MDFGSGETQVDGLLHDETTGQPSPKQRPTRAVLVPLSQIVPDRFQPRAILLTPGAMDEFYSGQKNVYETAEVLLASQDGDPAVGREIGELLRLGESILADNQIQPATGTWIYPQGGKPYLYLESGERRFWALALQAVKQGLSRDPDNELRLQVLEQADFSRRRQVYENLLREDLCAIDLAKAIASLVLEAMGIFPDDNSAEPMEYFRKVNAIERLPNGVLEKVGTSIGYSSSYCRRYLRLLDLDDNILRFASLYRIEEGTLRIVSEAPPKDRYDILNDAIQKKQSSDELRVAVEEAKSRMKRQKHQSSSNRAIFKRVKSKINSLVKVVDNPDIGSLDRIAAEISASVKDPRELAKMAGVLEKLSVGLRKAIARRQK